MTIQEIDQSLAKWQTDIENLKQNFIRLMTDDDCRRLSDHASRFPTPNATLTGKTKTEVSQAFGCLKDIWMKLDLLEAFVKNAQSTRSKFTRRTTDDQVRQLEDYLKGESVQLASVTVPFSQGSATSPSVMQVKVTADALLSELEKGYNAAGTVVDQAKKVWEDLVPELTSIDQQLKDLKLQADALVAGSIDELDKSSDVLAEMYSSLFDDPLGVEELFSHDIVPLLSGLGPTIAEMRKQHDQVESDLSACTAKLKELEDSRVKAVEATQKRLEKVQVQLPVTMPVSQENAKAMLTWLDSLQATFEQKQWKAAGAGLRKWNAIRAEYLAQNLKAVQENQSLIESRYELRETFIALRCRACRLGVSNNPDLIELGHQIELRFVNKPTPLAETQELIDRYLKLSH